ncbi:MAG: putative HTH-type transcriptional regulator YddM [Ignavibacteriaceae bacterium]|nr:putative HTH-type transcriptional regulator YddM [Ignavibacteriaceae bacterium]
MFNPPHPGGVLKRRYFDQLQISVSEFAEMLDMARPSVSNVLNEKAGISPTMAVKLAKVFETSPELWLNMQTAYDLAKAKKRVNLTNVRTAVIPVIAS